MKKYLYLCSIVALLCACKEEYPDRWSGEDRLNFVQSGSTASGIIADTVITYSFVFAPDDTKTHTVMVDVSTMGDKSNAPRAISIAQVPSSRKNAVAGTHYVAFDAPEVKQKFIMPAGSATTQLPITLIKENLGDDEVELRIVFVENEFFLAGLPNLSHKTIRFSNKLSKPAKWSSSVDDFLGTYSPEKHKFMYDTISRTIDDNYLQELLDIRDKAYLYYLGDWYSEKLDAANALLVSQGKPKHEFTFYN